ncbi:MAG: hypothetical protein IPH08_04080 [Rhodocyclaceae bacterium]|nr:hypothetical protein [Rhodocyclaceae bacterium]
MKSKWQKAYESKRRRLNAQLCESTGTHFMDSGGANGRMWQRNAKSPPKDKPMEWYEWEVYGGRLSCGYTRNTLDVLCEWLHDGDIATSVRRSWGQFLRQEGAREERADAAGEYRSNRSWEELLDAWADQCGHKREGGAYTYNEDNCLSQDIVYDLMKTPAGDEFVILRTHNGCDARGGFSSPTFWESEGGCAGPDSYWGGELSIDSYELRDNCPAVVWDDLWDDGEPPEGLTPEQLVEDVGLCIFAKGILYGGEGSNAPVDVLTRIWDECKLTEYATNPQWGAGFVVVVSKDRAVGTVLTYDGSWVDGEVYPY